MKKCLIIIVSAACLVSMLFLACEGPNQPEFGADYPDPNPTGAAAATLTSVDPAVGYLKDIVTINGSGFSSTLPYNFVAFGNKPATILTASATTLTVEAPNLNDVTVGVKVGIKGSEQWSNVLNFTFRPTLEMIDDTINWPNGVDVDDDGNIYIGSAGDGAIYKIDTNGNKTTFATIPVNGAIRFGPNNYLYVCGKESDKIWWLSADGTTRVDSADVNNPVYMDWDADLNMWICCNSWLRKLDTSGNVTDAMDMDDCKSCRVYGSNLYVTDIWEGQIWRFDITAAGLENGEVILETDDPCALEIDSEGTIYYSQAWETSIYSLKQDGSEEVLYEEELMTPMRYFSLVNKTMYIVYPGWGDVGEVMSTYIGVAQAPRYGRS